MSQTTENVRDIPLLYPAYFTEILTASGTPVSPSNVHRLVERTAIMIGSQAAAYCAQARDAGAFEAFVLTFGRGGSVERRLRIVDDMVNWLWHWNPACHDDLRNRFARWRSGLLQPGGLLSTGEDIEAFSEDEVSPDYTQIWRAVYAGNLPPGSTEPVADGPTAGDIGRILADGLKLGERLQLVKKIAKGFAQSRGIPDLIERGAQLLNASLARLPIRDLDTLRRVHGPDQEVAVDRLIDAAANQAGWIWTATAALPVPPPAAHTLKVVLHSLIELKLIAELYTVYGQRTEQRDTAWLNTLVYAWSVGHPVTNGPATMVGVPEIAAKLRSVYKGLEGTQGRVARIAQRGRDGQDLVRGTGSRFRRRMRYHPHTWPQPQTTQGPRAVTALVKDVVRGRAKVEEEAGGHPRQHAEQAWAQHRVARSAMATVPADPAYQPILGRLRHALDAQRQRLESLTGRMGIRLSPATEQASTPGVQDPLRAAHYAAEHAEQAIDRLESVGAQPRRLAGWSPWKRNCLVYLAVSLVIGVASGLLLAGALNGDNAGIGTWTLLSLPLCGATILAYATGLILTSALFRPWLGGPAPRSAISGCIITLVVTLLVPAAMAITLG